MKKRLLSISDRQDAVLSSLSEELGIPITELIRRGLDIYIETLVENGTLVRFTWSDGLSGKSIDMETPKGMYQKLYEYVKNNPNGALKFTENK